MGQEKEKEDGSEVFAESKGLPANAHAKKLAKEKAKAKKKPALGIFYTQRDQKVLQIILKEHGTLSEYVGNVKKHPELKKQIAAWKKEGKWLEFHEIESLRAKLLKK